MMNHNFRRAALVFIAAASLHMTPALAEEKPLFELGVAGGVGYIPDYPAAGQSHFNGIALPFPIYRGDFFRSDSKGLLRGRLVHSRDFELDISLAGSLDTDSDDNDARLGMPDLDHMAELGPRIQWTVARAAKWAKIDLELPIRAVFSTDFSSVEHRGFLIEPQIAYQHGNFFDSGAKLKLGISALIADEDLQDYFYQVDAPFVTSARAAYDGQGGYLGSKLRLLLQLPLSKTMKVFMAADLNSHHGAANEDSPLYREDLTYGAGVGLIWSFYQSSQTVNE
ncbi:MAG: MipA/OmpV family protein [Rhodospirillaceae bacterium]|jgi:outer membrane scaffolding protein for murein synthesis (MipA/OmpV family)|nr:MipA/OmpV family protein [Rhodospirillaceae bacterium]MBT4687964.1 MipA/OmpV family protein [Rhodospirillaceae bacterium]MBT5083535.1 MipA/OmpV family protein [Rhodospirillaceae bacterium]MBT5526379.1 MipA/OmpV family protein [Rhodospirillaceae bacterium]MBT5881331.1 MipA/OmpV family protein [Rhodospirillaceae bacterium]